MNHVGLVPEELLAVPASLDECDVLLEALWAAMPPVVEVVVGGNTLALTAERPARLVATSVVWDEVLTVDVAVLTDGWVVCPRGIDTASGVPLDTLTLGVIANLIRDVLRSYRSIGGLMLAVSAVRHHRARLSSRERNEEEEGTLSWLLCRLAARQEGGTVGDIALRLTDSTWHGTVADLLETARAVTSLNPGATTTSRSEGNVPF